MKKLFIIIATALCIVALSGCDKEETMADKYPNTLRTAYEDYFDIGIGIKSGDLTTYGDDQFDDFSTITAEYEMKWSHVQASSASLFNWSGVDKLAEFCRENDKKIRAHTLMWYRSTPSWVTRTLNNGNLTYDEKIDFVFDSTINFYEAMYERYSDLIVEVDVANEIMNDNSSTMYRQDDIFYPLFVKDGVFQEAEFEQFVANLYIEVKRISPDVKRYYNDYSMIVHPGKRANTIKFINNINELGADVQGIGFQAHIRTTDANETSFSTAINDFRAVPNLKIAITELDISIYKYSPGNEEAEKAFDETVEKELNDQYDMIFSIARKNADIIDNVTMWGATDSNHWLDSTVLLDGEYRNDHPTLFDDTGKKKSAYYVVRDFN